MSGETLIHMDGCHFFVWVARDREGDVWLDYCERDGSDLHAHGRFGGDGDGECDRCVALRRGATVRIGRSLLKDFPSDSKGAFLAVLAATGEIEEQLAATA